MASLSDKFSHIKDYDKKSQTNDFPKQNVWFDWGDKSEHIVRLVGDFIYVHQHWIAKTNFGTDYEIFPESAFKGDNALRKSILCGNWDVTSESIVENGCPICELERKASSFIASKDCDKDYKEQLTALRNRCRPVGRYLIQCIDRDNPYVSDNEKGFKILQMPRELIDAISSLDRGFTEFGISDDDKGIDIVIKKEVPPTGKGKTKYTVTPLFDGVKVKQTPLTEEEKSWRRLKLENFAGTKYERSLLKDRMTSDCVDILDINENDDDVPF